MDNKVFKFEIHLAEHCNLKCQACDHFSQLASKEFPKIESIKKDLIKMSELLKNRFVNIYLLGGEPLLNSKIIDYFYMTRKIFNNDKTSIYLITNGLLLKSKNNDFWDACHENNINIALSHYPININYGYIKSKCEQFKIKLKFFHSDDIVESMYLTPISLDGSNNSNESFNSCNIASRCAFVKEGKLYACPRVPNIYHFNQFFKTDLKISEDDYLHLDKCQSFEDIKNYLQKPKDFCKYCNIKKFKSNVPWEKFVNKTLSYWT